MLPTRTIHPATPNTIPVTDRANEMFLFLLAISESFAELAYGEKGECTFVIIIIIITNLYSIYYSS